MHSSRKRNELLPILKSNNFDLYHPFIGWAASYYKGGALRTDQGNVFMGERAARRFSIGLDDDNVPVFGIANDDVEAVLSVKWSSVAFVRGVQRKDWVVLACKDARVNEPRADDPIALRMWLPTSIGLLDGWVGFTEIETIRFKETTIYKGKPIASSEFLTVLPLAFKGNWEKAAEVPAEVKK